MIVFYTPQAEAILNEMFDALNQNYFSYSYQAKEYIEAFKCYVDDYVISGYIPKAPKKYFIRKYGFPTHRISYKTTSRNTWYILLSLEDNYAIVSFIHNNHHPIYKIDNGKK